MITDKEIYDYLDKALGSVGVPNTDEQLQLAIAVRVRLREVLNVAVENEE